MTDNDTIKETYASELTYALAEYIYGEYSHNWSTSHELAREYVEQLVEADGDFRDMYSFENSPYGVYYGTRKDYWERLELAEWVIEDEVRGTDPPVILTSNDLIAFQLEYLHIKIMDWLDENYDDNEAREESTEESEEL